MLLSQVIRHAAITGRTDAVGEQILGRQGGRWAHQWIDDAFPDPAIRDLRRRGVLTDAEAEQLKRRRRR